MNENLFIDWINRIWLPYSSKFPRSLVIMDQFSVHKVDAVKKLINKSKTDILLIPPGFTLNCSINLEVSNRKIRFYIFKNELTMKLK